MTLILSGTDGLSDVDGTAATPALRGTDANTGIFFPAADTIAFAEGGVEAMRIDSSGRVGIGTTPSGSDGIFTVSINSIGFYLGYGASYDNYYTAGSSGTQIFRTGNTERARIASTGQMSTTNGAGSVALAYDARAWVNFNGQGTVAIRASGNVSSITDNSTGNYFINFTTAMPDVNYSVVGSAFDNGVTCFSSFTTSSVQVLTRLIQTGSFPTGGVDDYSVVSAAIFR